MRLHHDTLPRADYLEDRVPTIEEGYTCDLKIDSNGVRIWLHRTSIEDGEPYRDTVTIEIRDPADGHWHDVLTYDGADPADQTLWIWTEYEHLIDPYQEGMVQRDHNR